MRPSKDKADLFECDYRYFNLILSLVRNTFRKYDLFYRKKAYNNIIINIKKCLFLCFFVPYAFLNHYADSN